MQTSIQKAVADPCALSPGQIENNAQRLFDIAARIGAFHLARIDIFQKNLEKMASATEMNDLIAIQQEFIQTSMDNFLSHAKSIAELMAHSSGPEFS